VVTKNLYEVLRVPEDASEEEIRSAFRRLAKKYHPDVAEIDRGEAEEIFKEIASAYTVLSDETRRQTYDQNLRFGGFPEQPEPRCEWVYQAYLDAYDWFPRYAREWNEHHEMMYR